MQFYIPNTVSFSTELSSGETDSFEELQNLIDNKHQIENELAERFADQVQKNAESKLWSTKEKYIDALNVEDGTVSLDTSEFVVDMVENGKLSFDMKIGLLNSPKAKVGKDGRRYLSVPLNKFRHGKYNWRDQKTGRFKASTTSGDVEFRIVSDNSPPDSWIHPGHVGFQFINKTLDEFDNVLDEILDAKIEVILNKF